MRATLQDFLYALRQLGKSPGLTVLAIVTLALGIGANTAMFTVADSVLLWPLPYPGADRLVYVGPSDKQLDSNTSLLNYRDIREQARTLDEVAGYSTDVGVVQSDDGSVSEMTPRVTPNLLEMLGARPELGRIFSRQDGQSGGPKVALLSDGLWRQKFHADPHIIGRTIRINEKPQTVIGVLPAGFGFPESHQEGTATAVWLPLQPTDEMLKDRGFNFFQILGRLKGGVSLAQAQAELTTITQRIRQADPGETQGLQLYLRPYQEMLTGPVRPVFLALIAALGLVLLIACADVANLLIARCLVRQQEFAVRAALGASPLRLARQVIVEGGLLSLLGSATGFGLAWAAITAVHKLPPGTIPLAERIGVRWTIVLMLAGIATATTVVSAVVPALLISRSDPQKALQAASRGVGGRSVRGRISGALVAFEVALSAVLLVATGLLTHTLWNLEHTRLGFDIQHVTSFAAMPGDAAGFTSLAVSSPNTAAPTSVATLVYGPVLEKIRHLPGVLGAAVSTTPPLSGSRMGTSFRVVGEPKDHEHDYNARVTAISDEYAAVMGTPVLRGRMISADDTAASPYVVVINDALARKYFGKQDPLGKQLDFGGAESGMLKPYAIVGVLADQVQDKVSEAPGPLLMLPMQQVPASSLYYPALLKTLVSFVVKTRENMPISEAVRSVFRETAPSYALEEFQSMQEAVDQSNFSARLGMDVIGAFGGLAVAMVIAGLYGVLAQLVSYKRREIGIRLALGATRQEIVRLILRQGLSVIVIGLAAGIVAAVWAERLVTDFLYEVKALDAWTYTGVAVVLICAGFLAAFLPARRASAISPMEALREQ